MEIRTVNMHDRKIWNELDRKMTSQFSTTGRLSYISLVHQPISIFVADWDIFRWMKMWDNDTTAIYLFYPRFQGWNILWHFSSILNYFTLFHFLLKLFTLEHSTAIANALDLVSCYLSCFVTLCKHFTKVPLLKLLTLTLFGIYNPAQFFYKFHPFLEKSLIVTLPFFWGSEL